MNDDRTRRRIAGTLILALAALALYLGLGGLSPALAQAQSSDARTYEDPQGRFTLPLFGDWQPIDTGGAFALYRVPAIDFDLYVVTVESDDVAAAEGSALRLVGIDPEALTLVDTVALGAWSVTFYAHGDGLGVTPLCQANGGVSHCLIAAGDLDLTTNPPDQVMRTVQAFRLAGAEFALPSTVGAFEGYLGDIVGDNPAGLSIVVTLGDEVLYAEGFGVANGPANRVAEPDTVWLWGSMVKVVTATAIVQLVEQGAVELDAPVSTYLEYAPAEHGITVRQLLTHSAGLGEPPEFVITNLRLEGQPLQDSDRVAREYFAQFAGPSFEPGSISAYSNPGFVILGQIVAEVSGQSYVDYVQEHILTPLGMTNTGFTYSGAMADRAAAPALPAGQADGLVAQLGQLRSDGAAFVREVDDRHAWMPPYHVTAAHGGLIGPATEAIRFAQMHLNGGAFGGARILSPESVALMQEMQRSTAGDPLGYGLSWVVRDGEHPYVEHDGGGVGLWDKMRLYPDHGVAIVLMSNGEGFDRDRLADAAANVVFALLGGAATAD